MGSPDCGTAACHGGGDLDSVMEGILARSRSWSAGRFVWIREIKEGEVFIDFKSPDAEISRGRRRG